MHELSLSRAILETAESHAQGRRVLALSVTVGALRQVVPDTLAFYFAILARGTVCDGAAFQPRLVAARMRCACGEEWDLAEPRFRCPRCGGAQVELLDGGELRLESIEVEEEPCTAPR
jgi:hydrogenase nickel incorporation protein HypA/HybF